MSADEGIAARATAALLAELPAAAELRHELHASPELSGAESSTVARVVAAIGEGQSPDVAGGRLIRIGGNGPAVGLRAELDALPVRERTGLPWASQNGAAHVCGHDVHMSALVAVARALRTVGPPVPLVAVLQPREEAVPSGAADLVASERWRGEGIAAMVGVHVQPRIPTGTFSCVPGVVNASSDDFTITLRAHGGHAGYPHTTGDPVVAAAEVVVGLQAVVARQVDPLRPAVITVGSLRSGDAPNVIPDTATVIGTVRAFDADDRSHLMGRVRLLAAQAAERHGCQVSLEHEPGEPPLANDPALASLVDRWIGSSVGLTGVDLRSCGSDDFSYYGTACPSAMVFYGVGDGGAASPGLHHPEFAPPDSDIEGVARCLLAGYLAGCALLGSSEVGID